MNNNHRSCYSLTYNNATNTHTPKTEKNAHTYISSHDEAFLKEETTVVELLEINMEIPMYN